MSATNNSNIQSVAAAWCQEPFDADTQQQVQALISNPNQTPLTDAFYKNLEFGTGGMRGIMGVGTNRMNKYTVGLATQGLCNYLTQYFSSVPQISVAIAYDCRHNSRLFAETAANIFSANDMRVYLFDALRPTPELSFAIRQLGCQSGLVITASHNPKEYNGYKAYFSDGAQLVAPHDKAVIEAIKALTVSDIRFNGKPELIKLIGSTIDNQFIDKVVELKLNPNVIEQAADSVRIVYTSLHGAGIQLIPKALNACGFKHCSTVVAQCVPDGNFSTTTSTNPEEAAAWQLALEQATNEQANLVLASDPDADRLGAAIKAPNNKFILLNGHQMAAMLCHYIITQRKANGTLNPNAFIVKTIVTSQLLDNLAAHHGVHCYNVYTGFKYIAEIIQANDGKAQYLGGGEESLGFLPSAFVRDKDSVSTSTLVAEMAAWAHSNHKTLYNLLIDIYKTYGYSYEKTVNITKEGQAGAQAISNLMTQLRQNTPKIIANKAVHTVKDYLNLQMWQAKNNTVSKLDQHETSNVLQFFTENLKISVRPSGTEPKIKFYFEVHQKASNVTDYDTFLNDSNLLINNVISEFTSLYNL